MTRLAVAFLTAAVAVLCAAPARASLRVEKTVTVRPAPHGGVEPGGAFEPGQSVQETDVALPRSAADCDFRLADARGRFPGAPFPDQQWKLMFAAQSKKGRWALMIRVVNQSTKASHAKPVHWKLMLVCSKRTAKSPPCFLHPIRAPQPHDYLTLTFHCTKASSRFSITLPSGYSAGRIFGADNSVLHSTMRCSAKGRVVTCRGRTPANTSTWLGFFATTAVRRGLPLRLGIAGAPSVTARTRSLPVRF